MNTTATIPLTNINDEPVQPITADRSPQINAVAITFLILSWIAVGLRCYVKLLMTKLFRMDDWLAVASLLSFTFFCAVVLAGAAVGTGRHATEITYQDFSSGMMWWFCGEISYITTTAFIKVSIGLLLLQICKNRYQKLIIWAVILITALFGIAYLGVMTFQCWPVSQYWARFLYPKTEQAAKCMSPTVVADMTYAHGAISTASDWTLGLLPIFLVWNLNMNPRTKISVAVILGLGAFGSTASIVRFPYIYQLVSTEDFLWANTDVSIWSTVEPGLGIVASSMATMRPLFVSFFSRSKLFGSSSHGQGNHRNGSQLGYLRQRENTEVDELELQSDLGRKIRVTTTVTNTQSKFSSQDNDNTSKSNDSERGLSGDDKWMTHMETESFEEVGYHSRVEGGNPV